MKLSVTIITFNEEKNIARAIRSVKFADEIIVVDSQSTDRTIEIVKNAGVRLYQWPFEGFGQQKNYAASLCQGEWILNIDADEEVSEALKKSIENLIFNKHTSQKRRHAVYEMKRLNFFCGKPIYHGGWYPDLKARLCLRGKASWSEPNVHEDLISVTGSSKGLLQGELLHYSFFTVKSQILTNLKYASLGAKDLKLKKGKKPSFFSTIFRPFLKFVECYFFKRGFLDGPRGLIIAINAAHSMFMKYSFAYMDENHD